MELIIENLKLSSGCDITKISNIFVLNLSINS